MRIAWLPLSLTIVATVWTAFGCNQGQTGGPTAMSMSKPHLEVAANLPDHCNAAVTSPDGRVFVNFPHPSGDVGVKLAEVKDGRTVVPYPDVQWNTFDPAKPADAARKFVGTNSIRFGPDGNLWVVDTGCTGPGMPPVDGGAKLVAIDVKTNAVVQSVSLAGVIRPDSFVDDVRFGRGTTAYLTDAGHPALMVFDLATGQGRRVLEDNPSTTARRPMRSNGKDLVRFTGGPVQLHADQLELSPDGKTLYFQPCPGPMSKIATKLLDDPGVTPADLARAVQPFYDTPTLGGTCIDADGNLYLDDAEHRRVDRLTPAGQRTTILADDRLDWGDAMWIDDAGNLWVPAAQQDTAPVFNGGVSAMHLPVQVFKVPLGVKPLRN